MSSTKTKYDEARKQYEATRKQASLLYEKAEGELKIATELLFETLRESGALANYTWSVSTGINAYYLHAEETLNREPEICGLLNVDSMGHYGGFKIWEGEVVMPDNRFGRVLRPNAELRFDDGEINLSFHDMTNEEMKAVMQHWGVKIDPTGVQEQFAKKKAELVEIEDLIHIMKELQ